ncbi:MAG: SAM-dependent methyltransferase [Flavobacteriales bacterium]|nr:MAG: SAM-dependent methyltransferase [Flavobacteriales bacterium]
MDQTNLNRKEHWENIYQTKDLKDVSWYQSTPTTSLAFVKELNLSFTAKIIDVGGGDSFFVDCLLKLGYRNITVLDISKRAIEKAKKRLGNKAEKVKWIIADAANFYPTEKYDFWHDRAAFHFLISQSDVKKYINTTVNHIVEEGVMVIGTFSVGGPKKCSGVDIQQYSKTSMTQLFHPYFEKIKCKSVNHETPFNTVQHFTFCSFKRMKMLY